MKMEHDMSDEALRESLSALVDGELTGAKAARVLDCVVRDPELREQWRRHHLISAVLSGHAAAPRHADQLAARVAAALATAPAPRATRQTQRYRRPWLPAALTASLAAIAVVAGLSVTGERREAPSLPPDRATGAVPDQSIAGTMGGGGVAAPSARISSVSTDPAERTRMTWNDARPEVEARLNAYLLNHNEYLAGGVRGMLPYARVVGYDARD